MAHNNANYKATCNECANTETSGYDVISIGSIPLRDRTASRHRRIVDKIIRFLSEAGGYLRWWEITQKLGGIVSKEQREAVIEELIRDGRVVEVWSDRNPDRLITHGLVLTHYRVATEGSIVKARGREDVIRAEYPDVG